MNTKSTYTQGDYRATVRAARAPDFYQVTVVHTPTRIKVNTWIFRDLASAIEAAKDAVTR